MLLRASGWVLGGVLHVTCGLVIAKDMFSQFAGEHDGAGRRQAFPDAARPGGSAPAAQLVEKFLGRPFDFKRYQAWLNDRTTASRR